MNRTLSALIVFGVMALAVSPFAAEANSGDFDGGVAIGSSYAGTDAAPSNGLIVQGDVGIGTTSPLSGTALNVNGVLDTNSMLLNGVQVPMTPGGRLTLTSNTPVMTADVTGASTVYYADYINDLVPLYNGTNWVEYSLEGQISLVLDSNSAHTGYQQSGKLFDLVVNNNSGTPQLCTGPAWTSNTARTSAIGLQNGIWTNSGSWTVKCDTTSSTDTCSANECTYVGTIYATANGQTQMNLIPAPVSGGTNNIVGLYNAYNHVRFSSTEGDSNSSWSYTTEAWRACDNSTANRITFVDGLQQDIIIAPLQASIEAGTQIGAMQVAMDASSPSGTGVQPAMGFVSGTGTFTSSSTTTGYFNPVLGVHYIQCLEYGGTNDTFIGQFRYAMSVQMDN